MSPNKFLMIRWLSFLPGAFIAAWAAWSSFSFIDSFYITWAGLASGDFTPKLEMMIMRHLVMGATFVYIGSLIAPKKRPLVAYGLTAIAAIAACFLVIPAVSEQNWAKIASGMAMAFGAGLVAYEVSRKII